MSSTEVCLVSSAELEMGESVQQHENLGVAGEQCDVSIILVRSRGMSGYLSWFVTIPI